MKNKLKAIIDLILKTKIVLFWNSLCQGFFRICEIPLEKLDKSSYKNKISTYYRNNPKMDYVFLISAISIIALVLFHKFIFGNYVFLFNSFDPNQDQICNYYPYMDHIFHDKGSLSFWSFNSGMGNNMYPMLNQFIEPFNIINALFWNPMDNGIIYMLVLKIICISIIFYKLILHLTSNRYSAFLTAILYSYSGFLMFMGQHWGMVNKTFDFILLLYAFEIYFKSKNKWFLIIVIGVNLFDFYFFIQSVIFVGFYFIFRNLYLYGKAISNFKEVLILFIYGIVGLLLVSFIYLPILYVIFNGPRVNIESIDYGKLVFTFYSLEYFTSLFGMFFSNNLSGNSMNYFGWKGLMASPLLYSGLICLLLFPQLFFLKIRNERRALIFIVFVSIITLSFPFFAYFLNGFQEIYFRWVYGLVALNLLGIAVILNAIYKNEILNLTVLKITISVLFLLLTLFWMYYRRHDGEWNYNALAGGFNADKNRYIRGFLLRIGAFLSFYFILIHFMNKYKVVVGIVLLLTISIELVIEHHPTFYSRDLVVKGDNPYLNSKANISSGLIDKIKANDKTPFFRIDEQYPLFGSGLTRNNAMAFNYYGIKSYTSLNTKSTYDFCRFFNLIGEGHWANVLPSWDHAVKRYSLLNILSIKYLLSKERITDSNYVFRYKSKNIKVYENKNFIPLGISYDKYISRNEIEKYSDDLKDSLVNSRLILETKDIKSLKSYFVSSKVRIKLKINKFSNSLIQGTVLCSTKKMLYFSIPYEKGWSFKVNGENSKYYMVNIGFIGLPLNKGLNSIELEYNPPLFEQGLWISGVTFLGCILIFFVSKYRKKNKDKFL